MDVSNLPLPPDLIEFVRVKMTTGEYASENEVVCEALSCLRERDHARALRLAELRRDIRLGLDQFGRGESKPFDANEIKAEVRQRLAASDTSV